MKKSILYAYVNKENREYIRSLSSTHGISMSGVINEILDSTRKSKKLRLKKHIPKYVERATKWKEKNTLAA